jgi:hypothetical protein
MKKQCSITLFEKNPNDTSKEKAPDTAFTVNEHKYKTCHYYYNKKGHIQPDCRKKKADQGSDNAEGKGKRKPKGKGNSTSKGNYNTNSNSCNNGKGKGKPKGYGRGNSWNYNSPLWNQQDNYSSASWNSNNSSSWQNTNSNPKGDPKGFKGNKGQHQGSNRSQNWSGNFPSDYNSSYAHYTDDYSSEQSTPQESDLGFSGFHTEPASISLIFSMTNETPTLPLNNAFDDIAVHVQHLARQMDRHRLQVFHPTMAMSREIHPY